jgi:hypothetical protein
MPSKKDPNEINTGSGKAGKDSVNVDAGGGQGGVTLPIPASQVDVDNPPTAIGEDGQESVNELSTRIDTRPNYIHEFGAQVYNGLNEPKWSFNPQLTDANFDDSGAKTGAWVFDSTPLTITAGPVFPADRGILAVSIEGTHVAAISLAYLFSGVSLDPEDGAPSRYKGQNDYSAGSESQVTLTGPVSGTLDQMDVYDRLPVVSDDYSRSRFSAVLGGSGEDPVYELYNEDFTYLQLARFEVDLSPSSGSISDMKLIHYQTKQDFEDGDQNNSYSSYAEVELSRSAGNNSNQFYYDDTGNNLVLNSYDFEMDVTNWHGSPPSDSASDPVHLSGVTYYGPSDTFSVSFGADGMFDDTFLEEGATVRYLFGEDIGFDINHTDYDQGDPSPGQTASLSLSGENFSEPAPLFIKAGGPTLALKDGAENLFRQRMNAQYNNDDVLIGIQGKDPSNNTTEYFGDELRRHDAGTSLSNSILPDGSSSSWDSTTNLSGDELIVKGIDETGSSLSDVEEGGCLQYPSTDYTTGHRPAADNGSGVDYSAASGDRHYLRSFDSGDSTLTGTIKLKGEFFNTTLGGDLLEDFAYDSSTSSYDGHNNGLRILIAPSGVSSSWQDLGRDYNDSAGALVDHEVIDNRTIEVDYRLNSYPAKQSGFYPVAIKVTMYDGSNWDNANQMLYQIAHL